MATVSPSSISKAGLIPGAAFTVKKNDYSFKCCFWRNAGQKQTPASTQRLVLPLSTSLKLFPTHGKQFVLHPHRSRATGTDVVATVDEQDSSPPVAEADANEKADAAPTTTISQSRGTSRPGRKSEMPSVKNEELVAGATFTGKVRAIQPFGAFVDFGAFTDGLVHVSQLSDTFVKDVASVVTIGQEVKVRLVEADIEAKRIALTMRENDDPPKRQPGGSDSKPRGGGKRNASKEDGFSSKYVKGQMLDGTVKNLTRSGAFITIGEGEEGFLPTNEEADDGIGSMMMGGGSSLQAGQEVKVRVLRIARGRVTLTMKEEDDGKFDETLSQGVVHTATNPFVLAFRKNEEIAAFLDKREEEAEEKPVEPVTVTVSESEEAVVSEETSEEVVSSETPKVEEVIETKAQDASQESTLGAAAEVEEVEKIEETSDAPSVPETKNQGKGLFGIKIGTWSLGSVITSGDRKQKPTTINRGLKRLAVSRKSSRLNSVNTVYRFRPYVSKVPWHTGLRAFLSQLFPRYGHYCGPNWSSGKDGGSLVWDQRPIDWLDHCCYCHDIGYDTHDQAEMLKADMAFLECLESNKHVVTRGDAHVAFFYKTMCITGLKSILIPYRSYLVKIQYGQNLLDFGWIMSNFSKRS
ncbi:unnamed protein product [Brassica rapa subsp. narinosa]